MTLQEMLGENYNENMTAEEISSLFEKKFVESGKYVEKGTETKPNGEDESAKDKMIKQLKKQLKEKMTDSEKVDSDKQELLDRIAELEELDKKNKKEMSKNSAESFLNPLKATLGIKDTDKDFNELIDNISSEDVEKSKKIGSYISKIVNDAYAKGKAEATKRNLGEMGNMVLGEGGKTQDKTEAFVKSLAAINPQPKYENSNFF